MWELDCEESWAPKNWCFWTLVLEKTLESPLDCKELQPVQSKGDQSWVFIGRTDVEAETPILWLPDAKNWLIWKDPDAGKDWGQEEKGMTEDGMVGWHHQLYGHGFGCTLRVGDGQGGLACCSSWGRKEWDMTKRLNWTEIVEISKTTVNGDCSHEIKRLFSWKESSDQHRQHIKKQNHHFANKDPNSQSYGFTSSQVWMWELDHKESWALKNWCFRILVLEKTLDSPLDCKEVQPVHPEVNQSWIFTGRIYAEAEAPILWPPDAKSRPVGKDCCWERLKAGGEGSNSEFNCWIASQLNEWVWANARR